MRGVGPPLAAVFYAIGGWLLVTQLLSGAATPSTAVQEDDVQQRAHDPEQLAEHVAGPESPPEIVIEMSYLDGSVRRVIYCVTRSSHHFANTLLVSTDDFAEVYRKLDVDTCRVQQRSGLHGEVRQPY
jgi:hypothetical protein